MMRLLMCGSRKWQDYPVILRALNGVILTHGRPEAVIEGGAKGADYLSKAAAMANGIGVDEYLADWDTYGKQAGSIRNQQMLDQGAPTHLLAFSDSFELWSGTVDMCTRADQSNIPMACLSSREMVEAWREGGCLFGPFHAWSRTRREDAGNV